MIITTDMLDKKVPTEMFPTRFDSATDLYTCTEEGIILYNINPTTWNLLYPFFGPKHKFTIDNYNIENKNITFNELIEIYKDVYHRYYEEKEGYNECKRKQVLVEEFNNTFGINNTTINNKLDFHYELKYSKSKNVYTLYYLESYIVNTVDIRKLLKQNKYSQAILNLNNYHGATSLNDVKLADSVIYILSDVKKLELLKKSIIKKEEK